MSMGTGPELLGRGAGWKTGELEKLNDDLEGRCCRGGGSVVFVATGRMGSIDDTCILLYFPKCLSSGRLATDTHSHCPSPNGIRRMLWL